MSLTRWLDPEACPPERPPLADMAAETRELHRAIDAHIRGDGIAWLHPDRRTIQRDLLGSPNVVAWQEAKAAFVVTGEGAWSELPHLYARYGTPGVAALIDAIRRLEVARCGFATDSGMQAVALVADAVLGRGHHAIAMRQVYNKTKTFLDWTTRKAGGSLTLVDDGDLDGITAAITPQTRLIFAETYTNPLMRAQDIPALVARKGKARLVVDGTIATPWAMPRRLLEHGVDVVVGSLTKAMGGEDTALGGYIATNDAELGNQVMDLIAMRGGILDDERARRIAAHLPAAERTHAQRCTTATAVARFLASHPRVERVFHPSLPDHPDAAVISRDYTRHGSIVSFRARGVDEMGHRHLADVLVSTIVPRYALSFDGLVTKVNHHRTVSEYFTPDDVVTRLGIDRLVRLGVGLEAADDVIACLNWALHNAERTTTDELDGWRANRSRDLQLR